MVDAIMEEFIIQKESASAFKVMKEQILRVIAMEGGAVGDFNAFNLHDLKERFSQSRTRVREGAHVTKGGRLWSNPGRDNIMFNIVGDTLRQTPSPRGAKAHDLLFARCSRITYESRGQKGHNNCQDQLAAAIQPYGLGPDDTHDAFNIFFKTGIDGNGRLFHEPPDSKQGDYVELHAKMDCLVAVSACPMSDSVGWGPNKPLKIQII